MDSDDDQLLLSPPREPSLQVHNRRLKRLKKSNSNKSPKIPLLESIDDPLLFSSVDFAKLEALENGSETLDYNYSNSSEDPILSQESLFQGIYNEDKDGKEGKMQVDVNEEVTKTRRILMFDDEVTNGDYTNGERIGQQNLDPVLENSQDDGRGGKEDVFEKKEGSEKKKRVKRDSGHKPKAKSGGSNKRREEKERKAHLEDLHAESQRLLRETRNAAFKPIPAVQKPISSVLQKIRKRKLEISKKIINDRSYGYEENISLRDNVMDLDVSNEDSTRKTGAEAEEKEKFAPYIDGEISIDAPNVEEIKDAPELTNHENDCDEVSLNEVPTPAFRAPVHDTQYLFGDSKPNGTSAEQNDEQLNGHSQEEFAPSLISMNLTLDSVPIDDSSSDEEDNDKENIKPHPRVITESISSPKGNLANDFVDDEAEEEDDSDNDMIRFKENEEDEDIDDLEELNDMIATTYEEKPIDKETRNELHQKWLEQQDAAGTDNLMQRLKCGSELRDTFMLDEEPESEEDDFNDEVKEESMPKKSTKVNIRKAKQIILQQLASDKEDVYVSDDEDDAHRGHAHRLLIRKEDQMTIISPADDKSSREVLGLIKKLDIVSEDKKKPKTSSSFFDSVLEGGNSNSSSKSSFLGRVSKNPIPSTHKQGSGTFRSFIFGRDDSNSRSSVSISEDSTDSVSQEAKPTRNFTAKYSNSQSKFNGRNRDAASETKPGTSLLDIMKRQSSHSQVFHQQKSVDLTNSIFTFRAPKKPVKIEGRN